MTPNNDQREYYLTDIVEDIAGIQLERRYDLDAPKGVNGRSSDNTLILQRLGWAPSITLRQGLEHTYRWIYDECVRSSVGAIGSVASGV